MVIESYALYNILMTVILTGTITLVIVLLLMLLRWKANINDEVFRKLMHFAAILMTPLCLSFAIDFYVSVLALVIFAIGAAIILRLVERIKGFSKFFVERDRGEIRQSFVTYCKYQALIVLVCGLFNDIGVVYIELLVWALGDALAALIGKKWGKKHFALKIADNNKTYLGSAAMLIVSFIISIVLLLVMYNYSIPRVLIQSLVVALCATIVELISRNGSDTKFVPLVVTFICLLFDCAY